MSISRVHHCYIEESIVVGEQEPSARSPKGKKKRACTCRLFISIAEATRLVKVGEAKWVVKERKRGEREILCRLCGGDPEFKNCAQCHGSGKQTTSFVEDIPGSDIVYTSSDPVDAEEKRKRKWLAPKTPRVATIESEHIERAYVLGIPEAVERIEDYGWLSQIFLHSIGSEIRNRRTPGEMGTPKHPETVKGFEGRPEPENNRATGEGRRFDYGRAI